MKLKENTAFWNKRSEIFDGHVIKIYEDAYRKTIGYTKRYLRSGDSALDIGCGTGVTTITLSRYVKELTAIDTSFGMMKQAEEKARKAGIENLTFCGTDMFDECFFKEQFNAIMIFNVLLYIPEQEKAASRLYELLKPGGYLFVAADCLKNSFTKEAIQKFIKSRTGRMPYVAFYTPESLMRLLKRQGFQITMSKALFKRPVNLFILAKKPEKQ